MIRRILALALALLLPAAVLAQEATPEAETPFSDVLASLPASRGADGAFVLGDPAAPRTLIEFADWACPHCIEYRPTIEQFIRDYVVSGEANFEFRILPTAGGTRTVVAAQVAECADRQQPGAFWQASQVLYTLAETRTYDVLDAQITEALGLDAEAMAACLPEAGQVLTDMRYASAHGISSTPAVLIREGESAAIPVRLNGTVPRGAPSFSALQRMMETAFEDMLDPQIALNAQFLAEHSAADGVTTTASGVQYRVEREGEGEGSPASTDTITLHYVASLLSGEVFDSSRERGEPVTFTLNQIIPGLAEAIQLMRTGDVFTVWVPPELAYGEAGAGPIPPNSILVFELELLSFTPGGG
jgi:FKBP-type peptidyl-prolyl cis-trans isomerase